ncbi:MAG: endonuclease III [Candidatus Latescibacteria bacterium]|nr:endonuclease III [Candidatus Latescibacterota bacterium]
MEERFGVPKWAGPSDPLDALIQTILSQNTSDTNSGRAYERLKSRFPTWEEANAADVREIADAIRSGGLANLKSERIKGVLAWLEKTRGTLDLDFIRDRKPDEAIRILGSLKGVGIKTISVVLMFACGAEIFPVDTHIHRITRRLGLAPENASAEKVHEVMQELVPQGKAYSFHMNLLKFGRTMCHARNPRCEQCPLTEECVYVRTNIQE